MRGPGLGSRLGSSIYGLRDPGQVRSAQTAGDSARPCRTGGPAVNPHLQVDIVPWGRRRMHTQATI